MTATTQPAPEDFDGNGTADILWRLTAGDVTTWLMNGTSIIGGGSIATIDPAWQIVDTP